MSIRVTCPSCKTAYAVPEEHRGKKLRCKKCQQTFRIDAGPADTERLNPAPAMPRPEFAFQAPSAGQPSSARQPKPEKSSLLPILVIGGAVAALLLLGGGAVGVYFLLKGPDAVAEKPGTGKSGPESAQANGPRLPLDKEVMGRLPFRNLGRQSEDYLSIRLVCWDGNERVIEYSHYLSMFVTKEDKEFRFKYPAPHVQGPGPVLFIFDIVEFDNEKRARQPFIVSNPVVVLVDATAAK